MRFVLLGVLYGAVLAFGASLSAGAGHGAYIPAALYGSPASLLGITAAIVTPPFYWGFFGFVLARGSAQAKTLAWILLGIHYLVAMLGWLGAMSPDFADWTYLSDRWDQLAIAVSVSGVCYLIGQAWIWTKLWKLGSSGSAAPAGA